MGKRFIDINCDLGEGAGNDAQLMPLISSCNIACGGHYGDTDSIREAVRLALKYNVRIGAHPSYPDTENFGRKVMNCSPEELKQSIQEQLRLIQTVCEEEGAIISHVKLHGALYNKTSEDEELAKTVLEAIEPLPISTIYLLSGCPLFMDFTHKLESWYY